MHSALRATRFPARASFPDPVRPEYSLEAVSGQSDIRAAMPSRAPHAAEIRSALHEFLAPGRAVSTAELRIRLHENGFCGVSHESVYKQLVLLEQRGLISKLGRRNGRRHTFWAATRTAARPHLVSICTVSASPGLPIVGTKGGGAC